MTITMQPQAPRNMAEAEQFIRERYGMYAFLLDHPEVGPKLRQAAMEGWPDDRVLTELKNTNWYRTTSDSQRKWDALFATNPGEARQQLEQTVRVVQRVMAQYGVKDKTGWRALELANNVLRNGWTADDVRNAVLREVRWDPRTGAPGVLSFTTVQVTKAAADYGIRLTPREAFDIALRAQREQLNEEQIVDTFRQRAKALFPHLSDALDRGVSVREVAAPYISVAADMLERDESTISPHDPLFQRALVHRDGTTTRTMTMDEWRQTLMTDQRYGWDTTDNARETAFELINRLSKTMGVR